MIGAGGFGREVMPLLQAQLAAQEHGPQDVRFVVEAGVESDATVNDVPLCSLADFMALPGQRYFNIAIADSTQRARIAATAEAGGARPISIRASTGLDLCMNVLGDGAIICPYAMLTSNVQLGRYVHLNIYSYVAHDCRIGDFVTFAPSVQCNGNVHIAEHAYIGTGATIRPGSTGKPLYIGAHAVVGMGAVVTKDVAAGTTVVGNPARPIASLPALSPHQA